MQTIKSFTITNTQSTALSLFEKKVCYHSVTQATHVFVKVYQTKFFEKHLACNLSFRSRSDDLTLSCML